MTSKLTKNSVLVTFAVYRRLIHFVCSSTMWEYTLFKNGQDFLKLVTHKLLESRKYLFLIVFQIKTTEKKEGIFLHFHE